MSHGSDECLYKSNDWREDRSKISIHNFTIFYAHAVHVCEHLEFQTYVITHTSDKALEKSLKLALSTDWEREREKEGKRAQEGLFM